MSACAAAVPLVLSAAGAGAQMAANAQAERAMNRKVQQELARQAQYQNQAGALYQQSAQASTPQGAEATIKSDAAQRQGAYEQAQAVPLSQSSAAPATTGTQQLSNQASIGQGNVARANYMGEQEWLLQQAIKNLRAQQNLALISSMSRGSQNVMPFEVQNAAHAGDTLSGIGSLASTAGGLWGMSNAMAAPRSYPVATTTPSASGLC